MIFPKMSTNWVSFNKLQSGIDDKKWPLAYLTKLCHWPYWYPSLCLAQSLSAQLTEMVLMLWDMGHGGETHTRYSLNTSKLIHILYELAGKNCRLHKLWMGKTCVSTDVIENSLNWNSPGSIPCLSPLNSFIAWPGAGWPRSRVINQGISAADHGGLIGGWETECGENNKLLKQNNILMITDDMTGSSRLGRKEMSYDDENFWELWSKLFKTFRFLLHSSPLHA